MHLNLRAAMIIFLVLFLISGMIQTSLANDIPAGYESKVICELTNYGSGWGQGGAKIVKVDKPEFKNLLQVWCTNRRQNPWAAGAGYPHVLSQSAKRGDRMLFTFWARVIQTKNESEQGLVHVSVNKKGGKRV